MKKITILIYLLFLTGCGTSVDQRYQEVPAPETPPPSETTPPSIQLSTTGLSFAAGSCGTNPASQTVEITKGGDGTLAWAAADLPSWLMLTPPSGTAPITVTAQIDTNGLSCGQTLSQTINIEASGASNTPMALIVTLSIPSPPPPPPPVPAIVTDKLKVSFTAATCGGTATSGSPSFTISSDGNGSFSWSGATAQSWIQFAPPNGTDGATVTVADIDTSNLPCGTTSSGTITITSAEAGNSPQSVTVEVIVPSAATINPSTASLGFFASACKVSPIDPQQFTIQNNGGSPLAWSADVGGASGWVSLDTTSGTVAVGATSAAITVTVDASNRTCGLGHSATITLTATSGGSAASPVQSKTIQIGLSNPMAWEHQNPRPTSYPLNDVTFSEQGVAWAIGEGGTLFRSPPDSPDYGNNWIPVVSGTSGNLHGIHFVSAFEGWIVGDSGTILHTSDGGATWTAEASSTNQHLQSVYFLDAAHGWAVGDAGTILYRNNSSTWTATAASGSKADQLTHIVMNDATHGWITVKNANESLLWTNDNWAGILPQDQKIASELYSIFFLPQNPSSPFPNRLEGWAVGAPDKVSGHGSILHIYSDTGLDPWTTEVVDSGTTFTLLDLFMSDPNLGWAVGGDDNTATGTILRWNGAAWSSVTDLLIPPPKYFRTIASSGGNGVAAGLSGMVFTSSNGTDWADVSGPSMNNLTSVGFALDGINGWAVGTAGTVLTTSNGGVSWVKDSPTVGNFTGNFTGLSVLAATDAWAVNDSRQIYRYNNGSWTLQQTLPSSGNLKGVHVVNASNGWAVGRVDIGAGVNRHVYYYNGTSWSAQTNFCDASVGTGTINGVYFIETTNGWKGWAVGNNRWIGYTTNGGADWNCAQWGPNATNWNSVHFISETTGWAVGSSGRVAKTINGGLTWVVTQPSGSTLFGVRFSDSDPNKGWIVGASGTVLETNNGGSNWAAQPSVKTNQNLNSLYFTPGGLEGWAVGANGVILHTLFGGAN